MCCAGIYFLAFFLPALTLGALFALGLETYRNKIENVKEMRRDEAEGMQRTSRSTSRIEQSTCQGKAHTLPRQQKFKSDSLAKKKAL
jgi:hypothetical protein